MKDKEFEAPIITGYVYSLHDLTDLVEEIERCIRYGKVDDYASKDLLKTRKQISILEDRIKCRVEQLLKSPKYTKYIQENIVSERNGRYVIPVKKEYRKQIKGAVLDTSSSGSTVYIEPEEVSSIQDEMIFLSYKKKLK
ncbi:hypothetical protein [Litchfieldia alkalitelluris]|uniref:hypothetical protein n=1 Tax=Litchfieldia alkalitelluris TaxID=304268 RepID=UPI001F1EB72F|nr:hypothetical protein [Litchfieldia alkalitelluris]